MSTMNITALAVVTALLGLGCRSDSGVGAGAAEITLDSSQRFQTIVGWEATAQAGEEQPGFSRVRDSAFVLAVDDLGINRLRLELRSGTENATDYQTLFNSGAITREEWQCNRYATVNDDDDPNHINEAGFQWAALDYKVEQVVLPVKRRIEANGERLYLNLNYVAFAKRMCAGKAYDHQNPEEYAEFILAAVTHLHAKYGLIPDGLEIILEPDNTRHWQSGTIIGHAIVAVTRRLSSAGFELEIIAPSTKRMSAAVPYISDMAKVPGAIEQVTEFSYHRYGGVSKENLRAIAATTQRYGLRAAMLEHIGSGHDDLHEDLETGFNSAWQQYTLAFPSVGPDKQNGGAYVVPNISDTLNPVIRLGNPSRYLRQYFRYIRRGAVRLGARSDARQFHPLAFVNADGRYVLVVKADEGGPFKVRNLPPGVYGISYTTADTSHVTEHAVAAGAILSASIPSAGVITVFAKPVTGPGSGARR
ncbi:MAG: hypothetical protein ACR2G6_17160 [Gemmatimonadaceae bacterium]